MNQRTKKLLEQVGHDLDRWDSFVRGLMAQDSPSLFFPGDRELGLELGDEVTLRTVGWGKNRAPQVWIRITGTTRRRNGLQHVHYILRDDREEWLHRDSSHGYTRNPENALDVDAPRVDPRFQERITREAEELRTGNWDQTKARLVADLRKLQDDPAVSRFSSKLRYIERQLATLDEKVKKAA